MNARVPFADLDLVNPVAASVAPPPGVAGLVSGFAPGSFSGAISNADYHALGAYLSHSGARALLRSPQHYLTYLNKPDDEGIVPNFGTAFHCVTLEPGEFDNRYVVWSGHRKGKQFDEFAKKHAGKLILNEDESRRIFGMRDSVLRFEDFPLGRALSSGEAEKSIFWVDEETGVLCRIRLDLFTPAGIIDLKSIDDARPENVGWQAGRMDYDLQAAMYQEGTRAYTGEKLPFLFAFAEDKAPHGVWLYPAGEQMIANGMRKFRRALTAFRDLQATNDWHCYRGAVTTLELPRAFIREL